MVEKNLFDLASMGGTARAKSLSAEERSDIARRAVETRWGKRSLRATHTGSLKIGEKEIPCAVLEDGTRLITQFGYFQAIGRSGKPAAGRGSSVEKLAPFLDLDNLKPFVDMELADSTKPIPFILPSGKRAFGYRADTLPRVCDVYLRARKEKVLLKSQDKFAEACEIIVRGLAQVGIIALIDEATGYQDDRDRRALAKILEAFISKELRRYVQTFPVDYYRELYRLRGLPFPGGEKKGKMPQYFGMLTNNIVYSRLAPGVLEELKRITPRDEKGRLRHHYHRRLTADIGHPKLSQHLGAVVALMKVSKDKDYKGFMSLLDRLYPVQTPLPLFDEQPSSRSSEEEDRLAG